jgi:trimethylamine corrinoid protein
MPPGDLHLAHELERALLGLDRAAALRLLNEASMGTDVLDLVEAAVVPALERIGCAWDDGSIALSQYYMCGRICEEVVLGLLPGGSPVVETRADAAIVTLEDRHQLGKRIVLAALASSGFAVVDLGCGTVDEVVPQILARRPSVLLVSTLLVRSALRVKDLRRRLREAGSPVPIVVGGAPFRLDPLLWKEVGADAMGRTALDAVAILREMSRGRP